MLPDRIRNGVRRLFRLNVRRPEDAIRDADAELESVIEAKAEYVAARAMSAQAAREEAERVLVGARDSVHQSAQHRERTLALSDRIDDLKSDIRYALRSFRRTPAFTGAAVITLALAIGANTAIYTAVSAVILRPLPYADPDRLVTIGEDNTNFHWQPWPTQRRRTSSIGRIRFLRSAAWRHSRSSGATTTLTGAGAPRRLTTTQSSGNFFTVLGVRPALGRTFEDGETWASAGVPPALLSYRAWRDVFGAKAEIVGQNIQLDGRSVQVAGVLPEGFSIPGLDVDVWRPFAFAPAARSQIWFRRAHFIRVVARLGPGQTLVSANAALQTVVSRLKTQYPATNAKMGASIAPLHDFLIGSARIPLAVAFGAAAFLLLIACGNIANLLLVRATARAREGAVRRALGAGRGRLVRQALTESLVLAALGGSAGLALGWWGTRALASLMPADLLPVHELSISWPVLGFVFAVTALCGVVFGAGPALRTAHRHPADVLKEEGRGSSIGGRTARWSDALLVSQISIALVLTLGAGLLVRSYALLQRVSPGFDPNGVLAVTVDLPSVRFDSASKIIAFQNELQRQAGALPGVESVALASDLPLTGPPWSSQFAVAGRPPIEQLGDVVHRELSPEYQQAMRVRLLRGRLFTTADQRNTPLVVLINETARETILSRRRPCRPADILRPDSRFELSLAHDRRRCRRRAAGGNGDPSAGGVHRARRAGCAESHDAARAHRRRSARARRRNPTQRCRARSRVGDHFGENNGRRAREIARARSLPHRAVHHLRGRRSRARDRRRVRCGDSARETQNERARHSHCTRRAAVAGTVDRGSARADTQRRQCVA